VHAVGLAVKKECNAIRRAADKYDGDDQAFAQWATKFYESHGECVAESIMPACRTLAKLAGVAIDDVEQLAGDYAVNYVSESRELLSDAHCDGQVKQLCDEWMRERPATVAVALTDLITSKMEDENVSE
jgi:hypothetical protein